MKIIGGQFRGRNFYMPKEIRPTQNIVRKALFDILGQDLTGMSFLDLFSGSGAVGLEAISRGAAQVVMVEGMPQNADVIQDNLRVFGVGYPHPFHTVINADSFATIKELARQNRQFHIVFADPPYGLKLAKKTLKLLMAYDIVHAHSHIVIQHEQKEILPPVESGFSLLTQRQYGASVLTIIEKL